MRSTTEVLESLETSVERYLAELRKLDMDSLHRKQSEEEWSIGQMYVHLIQSALFLQLHNIEQCLSSEDSTLNSGEEKTELGRQVFELGQFPPVPVKVPASPQYTPQPPESKDSLIDGLHMVVERMRSTEPLLHQALVNNKIRHPRLGALNAQEWFLLIEMHYRHHFLQLDRLISNLEMYTREGDGMYL
ncbi:DinB family protein [Paenibacillus sp. 1781tsa1]|uniref:DinB family protein n=1 Tax=Paenibacillus sp. 1781tsa1 TaxID=2953810 RepID=UPI00209DB1DF|nr:DinB family protein [Paenibacillus sp. 1781tsa1]MCP1186044.1 DinB family protein [Paenibacillus sp. 1781tsa1]